MEPNVTKTIKKERKENRRNPQQLQTTKLWGIYAKVSDGLHFQLCLGPKNSNWCLCLFSWAIPPSFHWVTYHYMLFLFPDNIVHITAELKVLSLITNTLLLQSVTIYSSYLLYFSHKCVDGFSSAGKFPSASVSCFCCVVCLLNVWAAGKKAGSIPWHEAKRTHRCQVTMHHYACILGFWVSYPLTSS